MIPAQPTLGTLLRRIIEELDGAVDASYARAGLEYRSRYTPIVRALVQHGPIPVRSLAERATVSHSAASQTVSQMAKAGLVSLKPGADARERIVALTPAAIAILPDLQACWAATEAAARTLDSDLGQSLPDVLVRLLDALDKRPFLDRILDNSPTPET
jgi:DNA-binding MarR family transcriptional regulator